MQNLDGGRKLKSAFKKGIFVILFLAVSCIQSVIINQASWATGGKCVITQNILQCGVKSGVTSSTSVNSGKSKRASSTGSSVPPCKWTVLTSVEVSIFQLTPNPSNEPGQWESIYCSSQSDYPKFGSNVITVTYRNSIFVWVVNSSLTSSSGGISPVTIAKEAENEIRIPSPAIILNPSKFGVVNLPEWLSILPQIWHEYSVTASVDSVSATAIAMPSYVTWNTGDGNVVTCYGPGVAYNTLIPAISQSTYCSHVFTDSSYLQQTTNGALFIPSFEITATITWNVSWYSSGNIASGTLGTITTSSSSMLPVVQIESAYLSS